MGTVNWIVCFSQSHSTGTKRGKVVFHKATDLPRQHAREKEANKLRVYAFFKNLFY